MAHELRTPMSLIKASLELMSKHLEKEDSEKVDISLRAISRLNLVTDKILRYSQHEDSISNGVQSRNAKEFFAPTIPLFTQQAKLKNIQFNYKAPDTPSLSLDWGAVQDISYNLISNAIKYTGPRGIVSFAVDCRGNSLKLTVTDTGIGIPDKEKHKVLTPYYRADNSKDSKIEGYGLGLSIVKDRVNSCNGKIEILPVVPVGTKIQIVIPEKIIETSPLQLESSEQQPQNSQTQLLIVEDDTDLQKALYYIFKDDYDVHLAQTKKDGLSKAYSLIPDAILSDVMLPDGNGFEILTAIRGDIRTSHIPFVVLTALSDETSVNNGFLLEANDYIIKPFVLSDLKLRVKNQLLHQERLQHWLTSQASVAEHESVRINSQDKKLMDTIRVFLTDNISNTELSISDLAKHIHMEGRTLERKMKALVGKSPNTFFIDLRLQHASQLLLKGLSVKSTAIEIGYKNSASFSRKFREKYGKTPSDFQKRR